MSKSFNNFLANKGQGTIFKSYSHATGLYLDNSFAKIPKLGFLYFVSFNINRNAVVDNSWWEANGQYDAGMLVKKVDLPKFKIKTETVNQYNRKTQVQTQLTYDPISIEFHDDHSEITNGLWKNYYKYYYYDSNYGDISLDSRLPPPAFQDTKYGDIGYQYGLDSGQSDPFFESIDLFVLHQRRFTQIKLINPIITSWDHDSLDQAAGKILQNKMGIAYEDVLYYQGEIIAGEAPGAFAAHYYDNEPSPVSIGGSPLTNQQPPETVFGPKWTPAPKPAVTYPTPTPVFSNSQLNKAAAQQGPSYVMPRPLGSGTFGLGQRRPGAFGIGGINVWYGHGGLHGSGVINAGPLRLVLKK